MIERSILEWITSYRKLKVLATACELGIFTELSNRSQTVEELAASCDAQPLPMQVLLNACVALGLLSRENNGYKNLGDTEEYLVEGKPRYMGNLVKLFSSEAPQWEGLNGLLAKGRAPEFEPVSSFAPRQFTLAMHSLGMLGEAEELVKAVPLKDAQEMVDVGCGSGVYSVAFCQRYPNLHATLIDREQTLEVTAEIAAESRVADQITLLPGDFTCDSYGENRDVVLLSDVLYGPPSTCKNILAAAYSALKTGGALVIRGYFSDPGGKNPEFGALFDVARMLWDPANEPLTIDQLLTWLEDIGFFSIEESQLTERSFLLIAMK